MLILKYRRRKIKRVGICKDCNRTIDNEIIKGMKCNSCGKDICYKCNLAYKCFDCYNEIRQEYYKETSIIQNA